MGNIKCRGRGEESGQGKDKLPSSLSSSLSSFAPPHYSYTQAWRERRLDGTGGEVVGGCSPGEGEVRR